MILTNDGRFHITLFATVLCSVAEVGAAVTGALGAPGDTVLYTPVSLIHPPGIWSRFYDGGGEINRLVCRSKVSYMHLILIDLHDL